MRFYEPCQCYVCLCACVYLMWQFKNIENECLIDNDTKAIIWK